jgi:hypothetical protein
MSTVFYHHQKRDLTDLCQDLLAPSTGSSQYMTIRKIDKYIHQLFYECQTHCSYAQHISHQENILTLVRNCEKQIFNDPSVVYITRPHFNGKYGTMSNILTSYYFYLYLSLLRHGVKINIEQDCMTIFCLLLQVNPQTIPNEEKQYVREILSYIRRKNPRLTYFNHLWWIRLIDTIEPAIQHGISSIFYQDPTKSEITKQQHLSGYIIQPLLDQNINMDIYGPYEYAPFYVDRMGMTIDNIFTRLRLIMDYFLVI